MAENLDTMYSDSNGARYPEGAETAHEVVDVKRYNPNDPAKTYGVDFGAVHQAVGEARRAVFGDVEPIAMPDQKERRRLEEELKQRPEYLSALREMRIPPEALEKLGFPSNNEYAGLLVGMRSAEGGVVPVGYTPEDGEYTYVFVKSHFLESMAARIGGHAVGLEGIAQKPVGTSTDSVLVTAGDIESPNGYVVVAQRGGSSFPEQYHNIACGSLSISQGMIDGTESILDVHMRREVLPETSERLRVRSATPASWFREFLINRGGFTISYKIETEGPKEEFQDLWENHGGADAREAKGLVFVPNRPFDILRFIRDSYKGAARRDKKPGEQPVLLSPGALGLVLYAGGEVSDLRRLHQEGEH